MRKNIYFIVILLFALALQTVSLKSLRWFPDIVLLMVVFAGIFGGSVEGFVVGLIAGFFRGCFSVETMALDMVLFPVVGLIASMLSRTIYAHNPLAQEITAVVAVLTVLTAHALYLGIPGEPGPGLSGMMLSYWRPVLATVIVSPVVLGMLKELLEFEE
ncbi:MAG: LytS/YhcK type 5TM receptor domain-containing protein [Candidatus Omnitrophica bacterium]|nr:LytS/YhcK type 5TM receptor domain-containing protein [Candidatus Omnitrophota bacterium]MDD5488370.1 LytS/YhcK type 5TM receptor domain-containing protein [Candidatus Omnitrophota bacterium]